MKLFKFYFISISALIGTFAFSQSYQDLQKLQEEYKKVLEKQALQKPAEINEAENRVKSTALPDKLVYSRKEIESLLTNTEKLLLELKFLKDTLNRMPYFGYDFFTKRDSIPFWQNLPISKSYLLGPGDEVVISLWGESNSSDIKTINRDGQIFIENIGMLNLGGKSLNDAKNLVTSEYSKVYSTLIGANPRSYIDLSIGELKSINVHFSGLVNIPGVHLVHPFSNVITGLIQAGGVNVKGTLRKIKIIRNGKVHSEVDIYDYLVRGYGLPEIRLLDQDIIFVSPRTSTIPLSGKVLRPGYYEILPGESLDDLLSFSGGKERGASVFTFAFRHNELTNDGFFLKNNEISKFKIFQGDSVFVPPMPKNHFFIEIHGYVKNPGKYPHNDKMRMKSLIEATMSISDIDFYRSMDLENITLFRKNPNDTNPLKILTSIEQNIFLKNGDHITISRKNNLKPIESVKITGEIKKPGIYPVNNLTTLSDLIKLSGGITDLALKNGIEIYRDSVKIAWEKDSFILNDGDSLNVLKKSGLIFISGEVNIPGYLSYNKNNSVKDYIRRAGGFTSYAQEESVYIIYPNGNSKPVSGIFSTKVLEGSTIIVNQKTISGNKSIRGWEAFSLIAGQAGNIATTLLSISLLLNQTNNAN